MENPLTSIAESQHGVISRQQALHAGVRPGEWQWLTRSPDWKKVHSGVYRRLGSPETWEQALMACCLAVDGVASHRAAGILWSLPNIPLSLEITVARPRHIKLPGACVHRTSALEPIDRTTRQGIPVTSLARTVIDLSLADPRRGPELVDHVLARRLVPLKLLVDRLNAAGTRGRTGAFSLRTLLETRQGRRRHVDSGLQRRFEKVAADAAKAGRLPPPSFEYPVKLRSGRWRYPDVAYPEVRVGFEAQSYLHHSTLPEFGRDQARNLELFANGWMIVPITEEQVRTPGRLVALMADVLAEAGARRGA